MKRFDPVLRVGNGSVWADCICCFGDSCNTKMAEDHDTNKQFHLFNCDETYKLDSVQSLLSETKGKLGFDISIVLHYFNLSEMSEKCDSIMSEPQMDLAVFVVHAHESRLSINEENAGIGYAKIYRALMRKTGGYL